MADKKHSFTKTELQAGTLVLLSGLVLLGFIAIMTGLRPPEEKKVLYARFNNTGGLNPGADVRFGGLKVGRVAAIAPDPEDASQVRVMAEIVPATPVNADSIATIEQITLTAEKHLEFSTGKNGAALVEEGAVVQSVTKSGGLIEMPDVSGAITRVEKLLDDVMAFMGVDEAQALEEKGEEEFAKIARIAADVREAVNHSSGLVQDVRDVVEEQRPQIDEILGKVQGIQDSVREVTDQVNEVIAENRGPVKNAVAGVEDTVAKVNQTVGGLSDDLESLSGRLEAILEDAGGLSGNAEQFLEANRPAIEDVILDLRETVRYLKSFSRTLSEEPESVIRGKTPQGRQK